MSNDLISQHTRNVFRDEMTNYWVLRKINEAFENQTIACDPEFVPPHYISGQRRTLIEQYYSTLIFSDGSDVEKLLKVFELVLEEVSSPEILLFYLSKDGYEYKDGHILPLSYRAPSFVWASELAATHSLPHLEREISRITNSVSSDPDLAVGTAKELVETICKTILSERGVKFDETDNFTKLVKIARESLKVLPEHIDQNVDGAKHIKQLLGSLGGIAEGMGHVRNLYGTGHGKDGRRSSLKPRHAKLAVGAATTLAVFLYETHLETQETDS